ncbi:MAG TPA: amino acid adenylation domain-containing protein, partial [Longimicrobium sp.]|nr:amino acid adenylation domain-containing protein [Longimicrobium sp.]
LREIAQAEGTTLYVVALAAWKALLARYCGSGDVVTGGVTAGRTRREVEDLIGVFVNTVVLRTDLAGDPPFRDAVRRVRECHLGAWEHQDLPFERLVAELRPERTLGQSPLFQVMFQFSHAEERKAADGDVRARSIDTELGIARFDLTLELHAHPRGLSGALEYAADLFDRATAERMAGHLQRLLREAAAHPDRRLSRLEMMDAAERARVVEEWNRTEGDAPLRCIHDFFRERARMAPDAPAVCFRGAELTYAEVEARANRLAHRLVALGAGPESRVGVCLERSVHWPVALLAVMKAGAAYVPLDPAYPAERLAYMLEDCGASVLVTQESLRHLLPAGVPVVSIDGDAEAVAALPADAPRTTVVPQNAAYVIYTSGSTGRPKGVQVTHANLANFFAGMDVAIGAAEAGTWLAGTSISFDIHVVELLWTLARGFRVVILPDARNAGRDETPAEMIRRHGVTHFQCTPSLAGLVVAESGVDALAGLDRLLLGGEALPAALAARIAGDNPRVLLNVYGPTETCVWSSWHPVDGVDGGVPIGRPLANQRGYVLDAALRPCPVGIPGELYIGGRGVTRGYLDRPGLTAERFVPDPFSARPGARIYRTGDRARWRADGLLECLGRADEQVKVNGYRIEPGEIETALRAHPAVRACVVVVREDRPGDRRLAAYVVLAAGAAPADGELRAHLEARLPRHMVPEAYVTLAALPLSPAGKLDRRALPAPEVRRAARAAPADEMEARLIGIWQELLGVEGIGATESFFDLGGTSIGALRLLSRVNARMGCDLPVSTLFTGATVRHMARTIRGVRRAAGAPASPIVPLRPEGVHPPLFLVHTAGGGVTPYMNVVRHLGEAQPVYGLRDTDADFSRPLARVAAEYVRAVRAAHPGPYYLAGWSYGGSVAFEMALQLEALGETAAFVGLMDTMSPVLVNEWPCADADIVAGLAREMGQDAGIDFHVAPESLAGFDRDEQIRFVLDALRARGAAPAGLTAEALAAECGINRDRNASRRTHAPGRFSGTLTLFRATELPDHVRAFMAPRPEAVRHDLGWSPFTANPVEVHPVPGSHNTMAAEPHVRTLVECMRASLSSARARVGAESSY